MFLSANLARPTTYMPRDNAYRQQNGNCIFNVIPGPDAVPQQFSELLFGTSLAKIVYRCVRAETGYLGGERTMGMPGKPSNWIAKVFAAGPPV